MFILPELVADAFAMRFFDMAYCGVRLRHDGEAVLVISPQSPSFEDAKRAFSCIRTMFQEGY